MGLQNMIDKQIKNMHETLWKAIKEEYKDIPLIMLQQCELELTQIETPFNNWKKDDNGNFIKEIKYQFRLVPRTHYRG